jgi:hypothetical protein
VGDPLGELIEVRGDRGEDTGDPAGRHRQPIRSASSCAVRATGMCWKVSRYTANAATFGP